MKPTLKGTQISIRLNTEIAEAMREAAKAENLSMSDFITQLFQGKQKENDLEKRLEAVERILFQNSQAA